MGPRGGGYLGRMRSLVMAMLCVACGAGTRAESHASASSSVASSTVEPVTLERQDGHWAREGFVELVPPVRLPTSHPGQDRIEVFVQIPAGGRIRTEWLDEQDRWTIALPAGTRLDRVESLRYGEGADAWTVADVRGSTLGRDPVTDHVYRPESGQPEAPLLGLRWPRESEAALEEATERLVELVRDRPIPVEQPPMDADAISQLRRFNDCAHCHRPDMAAETEDRGDLPHRATDADGFFVPLSVLARSVPISEARPVDLNAEDPYVSVACEDGGEVQRDGESLECGDGSVPLARRDVERGMREGDPYTQAVCASRRSLQAHVDARGLEAFGEAFAECGL